MMKVKVLDQYYIVMFEATVSDDRFLLMTKRNLIKPFIKSLKAVYPGTGNDGTNNEYQVEYDGYEIRWLDFSHFMNEADQ